MNAMIYQIGTDEAGYGPNLGPLIICGSRWRLNGDDGDLYDLLSEVVERNPANSDLIPVCDSKQLYKSSGSIVALERSVLSILSGAFGWDPKCLGELEQMLGCDCDFAPKDLFEDAKNNLSLPLAAKSEDIKNDGKRFRDVCQRREVSLDQVSCAAIFPECFNSLVDEHGNKAEVLSTQTLLIVKMLTHGIDGSFRLVCDKHGGRNRYLGLINQVLTDSFVQIDREGQQESRYLWKEKSCEFDLSFQMGGESFMPTAFSSMIAKYMRELTMKVWNDFWMARVPGIKPTKGYPTDAKRFRKDIAETLRGLKIDERLVWRNR